jgi:serine/threonine protein kinase
MTIERIVAGRVAVGATIARGRTSVVHEGTLLATGERVAVKMTSSVVNAEAAMRMRSEHALRVLDAGHGWLAMERLGGMLLSERLQRNGPMSIGEAATLALQICEAVAEAHALGIVHGDLGLHRVFLTPSVRVLGFARPSAGGDSRIDVFGVGTILLGMVGPSLTISPPFEATICRCLATNPDERFQTIEELAETLARFASPDAARYVTRIRRMATQSGGGLVVSQPPPSLDSTIVKPTRIVRYLALAIASAAIALLTFRANPAARQEPASATEPLPVMRESVPPKLLPPMPVPTMPRPQPPKTLVRRSAPRTRA